MYSSNELNKLLDFVSRELLLLAVIVWLVLVILPVKIHCQWVEFLFVHTCIARIQKLGWRPYDVIYILCTTTKTSENFCYIK